MKSENNMNDLEQLTERNNFCNGLKNDKIYEMQRPVYFQNEFDLNYRKINYKKVRRNKSLSRIQNFKKKCCKKAALKDFFHAVFPFISVMMKYKFRKWLTGDILGGVIVGIMHIPQSMAYAQLAGLKPIYGLYVSFFPVIFYFFFGTSRQVSVGSIAIISLLTATFLEKSSLDFTLAFNITGENNKSAFYSEDKEFLKAHRGAGLSFAVGITQIIMSIFKLGFLTKYFSDPLISGFIVGASIHVFTSQIKHCFGLIIPRQFGPFNILKTYYHIAKNITNTNVPTLLMTMVCTALLILSKEFLDPLINKKIKMPIPIELIVLVSSTMISKYLELDKVYHIKCVGNISTGLPWPSLPVMPDILNHLSDILITSIIGFSIGISLAKMFSKKYEYDIDHNQELLAYGMMNFLSSFFICFPSATSLGRSAVLASAGGKTQLASLFTSALLLIMLLYVGPVFHTLPNCILSSIIIVALKGMFTQFAELKVLWLFSLWDFSTWVLAFMGTVFIDVEYGLLIGIGFSVMIVVLRTQTPKSFILRKIKGTNLYTNVDAYNSTEIEGIKIFRFEGSLYYASSDHFRTSLFSKVSLNPRDIKMKIMKLEDKIEVINKMTKIDNNSTNKENQAQLESKLKCLKHSKIHYIILDCSLLGFIDFVGAKTLNEVIEEYSNINITIMFVNLKSDVKAAIFKNALNNLIDEKNIFLSIHDAVLSCSLEHHSNNFRDSCLEKT